MEIPYLANVGPEPPPRLEAKYPIYIEDEDVAVAAGNTVAGANETTTSPDPEAAKQRRRRPRKSWKPDKRLLLKEPENDGYGWRKYGEKAMKNSPYSKSYYKCRERHCPAIKYVRRCDEESVMFEHTYRGDHRCSVQPIYEHHEAARPDPTGDLDFQSLVGNFTSAAQGEVTICDDLRVLGVKSRGFSLLSSGLPAGDANPASDESAKEFAEVPELEPTLPSSSGNRGEGNPIKGKQRSRDQGNFTSAAQSEVTISDDLRVLGGKSRGFSLLSSGVPTGDANPASDESAKEFAEIPELESTLPSSSGNRGEGNPIKGKQRSRDQESECRSDDAEDEATELKKTQRTSITKRTRAAEVHNLFERRRRERINEKMKALQELLPNSNKADKATLDEAIEYIKRLQIMLLTIKNSGAIGMSDLNFMAPGCTPPLTLHMSHWETWHPSGVEASYDVFETTDKLEKEQCLNVTGIAHRNIVKTPYSHQTHGKRPEFMEDFLVEVNNIGESGYFVSNIWLFSLQEHEREEVMLILRRAGYLEMYQTYTTTFYERMEDVVQVPTTACTPDNNDIGVEGTKQVIALEDSGAFANIEQTSFNGEKHDDIFQLTPKTEAGPKTDVKCLCRPQLLTVSFTPTSPSQDRPSTSSSQGAQHVRKRSTRERGSDCYVTMSKLRKGRVVSTGVDKDISMRTINFTETGGYQEVPVRLTVSAETSLSVCVRTDQSDKQVLIELLKIGGAVKMDESIDKKTNALVMKSVRTNLDAYLNDSDEINLQAECDSNFSSGRRVLEVFRPCGDTCQSRHPEDLTWLEFSGIHPRNSELGSKTLELQCHVKNRLRVDREECSDAALALHFEGSPPVKLRGEILPDLYLNSFLELNLRYQAEISYRELCTPLPSADTPYLRSRRVNKVVDFDCILAFRTQNLSTDWSMG